MDMHELQSFGWLSNSVRDIAEVTVDVQPLGMPKGSNEWTFVFLDYIKTGVKDLMKAQTDKL